MSGPINGPNWRPAVSDSPIGPYEDRDLAFKRAYDRLTGIAKVKKERAKPAPDHPPFNTLMWRGSPLPEKWRGAEYQRFERRNLESHWELLFSSDYCEDTLSVFLDIETVSGAEANRLGQTFLEVINQRRVG